VQSTKAILAAIDNLVLEMANSSKK
jgi:hypothetical protein